MKHVIVIVGLVSKSSVVQEYVLQTPAAFGLSIYSDQELSGRACTLVLKVEASTHGILRRKSDMWSSESEENVMLYNGLTNHWYDDKSVSY